jgi:hypothetical protein
MYTDIAKFYQHNFFINVYYLLAKFTSNTFRSKMADLELPLPWYVWNVYAITILCQCFSPGILVSSNNKTDHHDITEILLKVVSKPWSFYVD